MNVFHLRPVVTLESTHDVYDAMARHVSQVKKHIENEPLSGDGVYLQAQIDLLWFFCDIFFSTYKNALPRDFADLMYAMCLSLGKRAEQADEEWNEANTET